MHVRFFLEWNRTRETNRPQASTQAAPKLSVEKAASVLALLLLASQAWVRVLETRDGRLATRITIAYL